MEKRKLVNVLIFSVYCIPWVFLQMYYDRQLTSWAGNSMLVYLLQPLCFAALGWYCGKTKRVPQAVIGSLVSCSLSFFLVCRYMMEESYRFKPFGITGFVVFLFAFTLSVQIILWRILRRESAPSLIAQFFETLAMLFVPTVILIFAILLLPHFW